MDSSSDAIRELRPPNTDPATYLTYLQQNLSKETLPTLHELLQDEDLTDTIGWDLVQTLLPLVPDSEECLVDVARLGNPKEVILKVTESLRQINFDVEEDEAAAVEKNQEEVELPVKQSTLDTLPLPFRQFQALVMMLRLLHPRIKAKAPSRFLSASLQAVLAAYSNAHSHHDVLTQEIVKFLRSMGGTKRPHLPPRRSTSAQLLATLASMEPKPASDLPAFASDIPVSEEDKIQSKLLQSFLTHLLDDYMQSLDPYEDISGLGYCARYWEKIKHPYNVPSKISVTDQFSNSAELETRLTIVGQLVAVAQDLQIHTDDLLVTILDPSPEESGDRGAEEEFPTSADDIPFSKTGALYLLTARKAMEVLYDGPSIIDDIAIFPGHEIILRIFVAGLSEPEIRQLPDALLDALLFHGLLGVERLQYGDITASHDHWAGYLQYTGLLASSVMSPSMRFYAYFLTKSVLAAHPKDTIRFGYIQDVLQHCPFENLTAAAVGWLKDETLGADWPWNRRSNSISAIELSNAPAEEPMSLFATPIPLSTLAPYLLPDLTDTFAGKESSDAAQQAFAANYGTYAATLNFLYTLLRSKHLHAPLELNKLFESEEVVHRYVRPLRALAEALEGSSAATEVEAVGGLEVNMVKMLTGDVERAVKELGWLTDAEDDAKISAEQA